MKPETLKPETLKPETLKPETLKPEIRSKQNGLASGSVFPKILFTTVVIIIVFVFLAGKFATFEGLFLFVKNLLVGFQNICSGVQAVVVTEFKFCT